MKKQKRKMFIIVLFTISVAIVPIASYAQDSSLVNLLMQKLGVTETQAQGGAGALFSMAKQKLSPQDFSQVAATVPEMDTLLQAAPKTSGSLSDMVGQGSSLLGGGAKEQLDGATGLASAFSQLGLSPDMVNKYMPVVLDYVQSKGGETVKNLLASALL